MTPRAGDAIRRVGSGELRKAIAVADVGRWVGKEWVPCMQVMASGESRWTPASDWEVAFPGHGWVDPPKAKRTRMQLDEAAYGGAVP